MSGSSDDEYDWANDYTRKCALNDIRTQLLNVLNNAQQEQSEFNSSPEELEPTDIQSIECRFDSDDGSGWRISRKQILYKANRQKCKRHKHNIF